MFGAPVSVVVQAQQPTGSIPTVTSTPLGPYIIVNLDQDQINVRAGPSTYLYPPIGVLLGGQRAPALGRSPGGDWIQIQYPGVPGSVGWVYAPLVSLSPGANLPIVEPPPTPTPIATPTIDPTLAAAFIAPATPTRLPTFTPPPPLEIPTFTQTVESRAGRVPMGLVIFGLGFLGLFGMFISLLRGR
ncbi:MAG: hypothetical protein D6770_05870 [Anaerolineae bacterium]|nr:MAG: hypothetical protein D6770_05870 [Anaerolineae bacterium]